jgi:hypothetical protein
VRRLGADGRHADDARREGCALQHQLPALVRGRRRDQGRAGGALPRSGLLRRHRHHGRPRRRRPGTRLPPRTLHEIHCFVLFTWAILNAKFLTLEIKNAIKLRIKK